MVTLIVPTMNRSDFMIRLLHYYGTHGFSGCICIGDSSGPEHIERTKIVIKKFEGRLNIVYREYPNLKNEECTHQLLEYVSTPYAALLPDDDFLVPSALNKCVQFLDEHLDYSAAHGIGAAVSLQSSGAYGKVSSARYYTQPVLESRNASQRLLDHLGAYSVSLFSVHRVESWQLMWRDVFLLADRAFASELMPCCLSATEGKVKELDCLYLVRQVHDQRVRLPELFDWLTSKDWQPSYIHFRDCLADELVRQDGITIEAAQEVVKQAFWMYLNRSLPLKWGNRYSQNNKSERVILSQMKQFARQIPGVPQTWRILRSMASKRQEGGASLSLTGLLKPSSPYYDDFMPVYHAMTKPAETSVEGVVS